MSEAKRANATEMAELANLALAIACDNQDAGKPDDLASLMSECIVGTEWTFDAFERLCKRVWNGPAWVQ